MRTFLSDLPKGHKGEKIFGAKYSNWRNTDGRTHDLVNEKGETMEVKFEIGYRPNAALKKYQTDSLERFLGSVEFGSDEQGCSETRNFAVERYSDMERQTPGGPWQSKADFYAHIFRDGTIFVFKRTEFLTRANQLMASTNPRTFVKDNGAYKTLGYRLEISDFLDLIQIVTEYG